MFFLNPAILIGLAMTAIPLIIHFLSFQKKEEFVFSSIRLIKEIKASSLRKFQFRQWLLLLLRSLAVFFIIAAFAKPVLEQFNAGNDLSTRPRTSVVLILDSSPSMLYTDRFGYAQWKQAKQAALKIIDNVTPQDELFLSFTGLEEDYTRSYTLEDAKRKIISAEVNPVFVSMEKRLLEASNFLKKQKNLSQEIYLVSDFHPSGFYSNDSLSKPTKLTEGKQTAYFIQVSPPTKENISLKEPEVISKLIEPKKPIRIQIEAASNNTDTSRLINSGEIRTRLFINEKLGADRSVLLNEKKTHEILLTATPNSTGFISYQIDSGDDNLSIDNKRYGVMFIPEKIKILLVSNSISKTKFIRAAFESYEGNDLFEINTLEPSQLESRNLDKYDNVFVVGMSDLTTGINQKLSMFVANGGGLVLFSESYSNPLSYEPANQLLRNLGLGIFQPEPNASRATPFSTEYLDQNHPLFEGTFLRKSNRKNGGDNSDLPIFYQLSRYQKSPKESLLLQASTGIPIITASRMKSGEVILFNTLPISETGTLVFHPLFAPLIFRSVFYTFKSGKKMTNHFWAGEPAEIPFSTSENFEQIAVKRPNGESFFPKIIDKRGLTRLRIEANEITQCGHYDVVGQKNGISQILYKFAVNYKLIESDITSLTQDEIVVTGQRLGIDSHSISLFESNIDIESFLNSTRFGFSIWKILLGVALLLLLTEGYLGRKIEA